MGGVSNPWPLVELLSCLGMGINSEIGAEIGEPGGDDVYASVATIELGAQSMSTTGTLSSREILKRTRLFQRNIEEKTSVTHLVSFKLSDLESISVDDGVGAPDK